MNDAIECANETPGLDTIDFAIAGAAPHTIGVDFSRLITDAVIIDAAPGEIILDGSIANGWIGLNVEACGIMIRNLEITGFDNSGIRIAPSANTQACDELNALVNSDGDTGLAIIENVNVHNNGQHGLEVVSGIIDPFILGHFDASISLPPISLAGVDANSATLSFDSSWNPNVPQVAEINVSFDGNPPEQVLLWESWSNDENYKEYTPDENLVVPLPNPSGASEIGNLLPTRRSNFQRLVGR